MYCTSIVLYKILYCKSIVQRTAVHKKEKIIWTVDLVFFCFWGRESKLKRHFQNCVQVLFFFKWKRCVTNPRLQSSPIMEIISCWELSLLFSLLFWGLSLLFSGNTDNIFQLYHSYCIFYLWTHFEGREMRECFNANIWAFCRKELPFLSSFWYVSTSKIRIWFGITQYLAGLC